MTDNLLPGMSFQDHTGPDGIYASCHKKFIDHPDSLARINFSSDFLAQTNVWPVDHYATRFYRPLDIDQDLAMTLFGEVLDESNGTGLGVKGGSKRTNPKFMDPIKIKDILTLGVPTDADKPLVDLFNDQIVTLRQVVEELPDYKKRVQWTKHRMGAIDPSIISVNLPYKYMQLPKPAASAKLQKCMSDKDIGDSKPDQILLTSTYEPDRMGDFDQSLKLQGAQLTQQPIYDQDSELVPPCKAPFVFRKGALIAVEAQLSVFHFVNDPKDPNHLFQLLASRVKILAPSPLAYQELKPFHPLPQRKVLPSRSSMFDTMMLKTSGKATGLNMDLNT
ncbi:hypothetical protein BJ322DRAFT_1108108 [Thelephora terrestris]|uniref:Uncharacterized protein n=1 Tax=Thelephora terrestris TaxID=56493 RepID=A0A9P6L746_9AGAM|nr:hypothetical protein BJ322DRAFT_1108108 [Thelephora terrestris]